MGLPKCYMPAIVIVSLALSACGNTSTIKKTFDHPLYTDSSYSDILIIAVAGDYDDRASFERAIVSGISAEGAHATAYYTVVGRHQPITRNTVSAVVAARGYRAVLLARVLVQANYKDIDARVTILDRSSVNLIKDLLSCFGTMSFLIFKLDID